jgi:hypothetical protein
MLENTLPLHGLETVEDIGRFVARVRWCPDLVETYPKEADRKRLITQFEVDGHEHNKYVFYILRCVDGENEIEWTSIFYHEEDEDILLVCANLMQLPADQRLKLLLAEIA